jgi:ribosomal protein S18 acetylase RimI-like enzyme
MNPVSTRLAERSDAAGLAELARLNTLFNGACDSAEQIAARLSDPRRVECALLAEVDERIIGFAGLRIVPTLFYPQPYAELTELFVEEAYRRRGAGRALVTHAESLARQAGAHQMLILTDFENHVAQALYREMGYTDHDLALSKELTA